MKNELSLLKQGEMSFDRFLYLTQTYWRKVATDLIRRWETPPAIDVDDVYQELVTAVWKAVGEHDGDPSTLRQYVIGSALSACKRWIHRQRESWGWRGDMPSRFPVGVERIEDCADDYDDASAILDAMHLAQSVRERAVLRNLAQCRSINLVAQMMYDRIDERLRNQFDNEQSARRAVYRSTLKMARLAENV